MKNKSLILLLGVKSYQAKTETLIKKHYPKLESLSVEGSFEEVVKLIPNDSSVVAAINRGDEQIETHSKIVDHYQLAGPSFSAVKHFRNKAALDQLMKKFKLSQYRPQTKTTPLHDLAFKLKTVQFPVIIKPFQGAKSRGVYKLEKADDLTSAIIDDLKHHFATEPSIQTKDRTQQLMLIEEFIVGRQTTVTAYVDHLGKFHNLGFVDVYDGYDVGENHRQLVHRTTSSKASYSQQKEILKVLERLVEITGLRSTFIHPDFIINQQEIKLIEFNARMGGLRNIMSQIAHGLDLDFFALQLALAEIPDDNKTKDHSCTGTDVWFPQSGVIEKIDFPNHPQVVKEKIHFQPGEKYLAPPKGNQQLIRFYLETKQANSLELAKKLKQETKIIIK